MSWTSRVALALALAACGSNGPTTTTMNVGPAGGMVTMSGVTLVVPAGALAAPTDIVVTATAESAADYDLSSPIFHFEPDGTTFTMPFEIRIQLDGTPAEPPQIYWSGSAVGESFVALETTMDGNTAVAHINHFSRGFAGKRKPGQNCTDALACPPGLICQGNVCVAPAICGDSTLQSGEACDDGNTMSNDGCSASCQTETPVDGDGDSYNSFVDCNDGNANIHPGATDTCYDCLDNDCAGGADTGCATVQCGDGIDNDGSGGTDFPADQDCRCATDQTEGPCEIACFPDGACPTGGGTCVNGCCAFLPAGNVAVP